MNNFNNNELEFLDIITIAGFIAQMQNMEKDDKHNKFIHQVINTIAQEIQKLHNENDIIMAQNEKILNLLKKGGSRS